MYDDDPEEIIEYTMDDIPMLDYIKAVGYLIGISVVLGLILGLTT